jgi:cyanophycinase
MKTTTVFLAFILLCTFSVSAQSIGPKNGKLMIVGGGAADALIEQFVEMAGGKNANIVVIPTAGNQEEFDEDYYYCKLIKGFGAKSVSVIHTRDPKTANTGKFCKPLRQASGIWFTGGRQWKLVDAYMNTQVVNECWNVLERGGIIGGSSAGATIQGSYLARGDTNNNTIMMGDHEKGFAFVKNVAIDQHLLARNRQFDMFEILKEKPGLLGIGLDESTAILVEGDTFKVIGKSYVAVYDDKFWRRDGNPVIPSMQSFYLLKAGDKYNLKNRTIIED